MEGGRRCGKLEDEMEEEGVVKGVLCSGYTAADDLAWIRNAIEKHPDRFVGSHVVDPRLGLEAVRLVDNLVRSDGFRLIRVLGLQTQIYYNDPMCYPVYAKCAELGIPVGL